MNKNQEMANMKPDQHSTLLTCLFSQGRLALYLALIAQLLLRPQLRIPLTSKSRFGCKHERLTARGECLILSHSSFAIRVFWVFIMAFVALIKALIPQ